MELGLLSSSATAEQEAAVKQWLGAMDSDGNGSIEWDELLRWWHEGGKAVVTAARMVGMLRSSAPSLLSPSRGP